MIVMITKVGNLQVVRREEGDFNTLGYRQQLREKSHPVSR